MISLKEKFKRYIKYAECLREFCDLYHNYEYTEQDFEQHRKELLTDGYTIIPSHDSVTGEICSFYGSVEPNKTKDIKGGKQI